MLAVAIAAGGRAKNAPEQGLALSYLDKARDHGRALGFHGFRLTEADSRTGERLAAAIKGAAFGVALDERGQSLDSVQFARWLADLRDRSVHDVCFVIGGADGLGPEILAAARFRLAFGVQTWPHLLVRTLVAEQLFRAMTILSGHPYHRV